MPGPVTFIGAADVPHCGPMVRMLGSPNTFVNGIPISRQGDINTPHLFPAGPICPTHAAPIAIGSTLVRVNGRGCGRIFDFIAGCTFVAQGSPNVIDHSP